MKNGQGPESIPVQNWKTSRLRSNGGRQLAAVADQKTLKHQCPLRSLKDTCFDADAQTVVRVAVRQERACR